MYSKSTSALSLNYNTNTNNTSRESESSILSSQILPDLSHLSEAERQIISSVLQRQQAEEECAAKSVSLSDNFKTNASNTFARNLEESEFDQIRTVSNPSQQQITTITASTLANTRNTQPIKYSTLPHTSSSHREQANKNITTTAKNTTSSFKSNLHQCHSISDIANEAKQRYGSIDTGNFCDICKKTKFTHSGAGHICFNCKLRCCVRCAFKFQTRTKQIWTCVECKKKQDTLLRSGKWFSESTNLNKKSFTSDYILNKGVNTPNRNNNNNTIDTLARAAHTNTTTSPQPTPAHATMSSNTIDTHTAIKAATTSSNSSSRRVLPTIVKQQSVQQLKTNRDDNDENDDDDDDDEYDEVSRRTSRHHHHHHHVVSLNAQFAHTNETNTTSRSSIDNTNSSRRRQPLLKQVSLNNPPTYLSRTSDASNPDEDYSLYTANSNTVVHNNNNSKSFTSNQDLGNEQQSNSSQNSSINNLNRTSTTNKNRERLQDPQQILKTLKSNPNSRLNSMTNLSNFQAAQDAAKQLNPQESLHHQVASKLNDQLASITATPSVTKAPATAVARRVLPTSNPVQRAKQLLLHATDSLSSDPSDYQQSIGQLEFKSNLEEMSRKPSKTKRNTRNARKQPTIPVNSAAAAAAPVSLAPTSVVVTATTLMKHNLKQHSLTSSDDDLIINLNKQSGSSSKRNKNDYLQDPEEEEDNFNDDDVDEEIRSTTEMSTNDEMELESGSVSINNLNKNRVSLNSKSAIDTSVSMQQPVSNLASTLTAVDQLGRNEQQQHGKSIDDYLVQNLKKDEILAAKMSKFLSPTNWQLSSDGKKMIGHLILKHDTSLVNSSSTSTVDSSVEFNVAASLGLKIVGGRANPFLSNQLCAYVVKVRKDSVGDSVGRLQVDDEIVKWNGKLLRGLTYDEVYSLLTKSRSDNQVELSVERLIDDSDRMKLRSSLWSTESATTNNADLKISQQHQLDQDLFSKIDSNNTTSKINGKIQLKIFHDSIERILYINVLNLSINYCNYNEQTTLETTTNDYFNNNYNNNNSSSSNYNSNRNIINKNEVVESIYLHLLLKKRNIDQFKKISKICKLDKTTGLYLINEAFTFEPVNSIDLHDLNIDLQAINYLTKQPLGKLTIEYSEEMFDNQLLNLNMLPINSNNQTNLNKTLHQPSHFSQTTATNNNALNANQNSNSRRRQLPQIPPPTDNRSDKGSVDLTDKSQRSKPDRTSDSEPRMAILSHNTNQFEDQSSLFNNQQQQQQQTVAQPIKMRTNNLLPKQYSDRSDYSAENDESLFTNNVNSKPTFQPPQLQLQLQQQQQHQDQPITKRQQPVVPLARSRLRDVSQTSRSPINVNDDKQQQQQLYGQQHDTAQFNSPNYRSVNSNNKFFDNNLSSNLNGDTNENITAKHLPQQTQQTAQTSSLAYRSPSPPSPPPTITSKPIGVGGGGGGQRQLPQPVKPQVRQPNINSNNSYLPQEWPDADIPVSSALNNQISSNNNNNNNNKPDRLKEESLLLDLKTKTSDLYASNSTNTNNINTGLLSQSPDNFNNNINNNRALNNINNIINKNNIQSPFKQNSFDYPTEYSKTNTLDSQFQQQQQQSNNTPGTMPRRAEKLFSTKQLNQRLLGNNLTNTATQPSAAAAHHGYNRNGFEFDSDGSEHSQFSNVSKLSSTSVKSAQSELLKGANTTLNNLNHNTTNRKTSKLPNTNLNTTDNRLLSQLPKLQPQQQQQQQQQQQLQSQQDSSRLVNQPQVESQDLLLSNNFNQMNPSDLLGNDWNAANPAQKAPVLPQQTTKLSPPTSFQQQQQQQITPLGDLLNQEPTSSSKQSKQIDKTTTTNTTTNVISKEPTATATTTPTAATSTTIKSTTNIPIPSYIKSKDNPTYDFFTQFSTPVKQTSKNNSTMSLPGQSMQQTTINNTTITKETDGTLSDSALSNPNNPPEQGSAANKKRRPSMAKALVILGLSKKSNSASNLTLGKRYGFARSEEIGVVPELRNLKLNTAAAQGDQSGAENNHPKPRLWSGALKLPHEVPYNDFIDGLGPGQKISRQALGLPCLGEVKMSLFLDRQKLNIEIQQARNLKIKTGYRVMPISVYIKLYLFNGTSCVEKQKTTTKRRTLNPTFQETLKFETTYRGTILQLTCWGDYGKLDRKVFMGVAQIALDELNLSNTIIGWYKLYPVNSIVTDFSTLTPATDLCETESGYSLSSK